MKCVTMQRTMCKVKVIFGVISVYIAEVLLSNECVCTAHLPMDCLHAIYRWQRCMYRYI